MSRRYSRPITDTANFLDTGGGGLLLFNAGPMPSNAPPTPFERGIVRADPSTFGMMDPRNAAQDAALTASRAADRGMEVLPEDQIGPTEELGVEDSIFQILYDTIIGEQGVPEGVSPEVLGALRGDFGPTTPVEQLREIAEQIAEAGGFEQWSEQQQAEESEEVVDITQDDTTVADDSELADTTTPEDAQPIPDYSGIADPDFQEGIAPGVGSVGTGAPTSTPTTPMTPPPGSAGVIIDIEDLMNAGDWTVFLPGVIPGLPSSPTILGTVEEILNNPSGIFDDLLEDLKGIVTNPEQVLEDILNDAADSNGLITIGSIQSVISDIMDRIEEGPEAPPATIATEQDPTIIGGAEDEEEVSEPAVQETITEESEVTTEPPAVTEEVTTEPPAVTEEVTTEPPAVTEEVTTEPPAVTEEVTTEPPAVTEEVTTEPPAVTDTLQPETTVGSGATTDSPEPQPEVGGTEDVVSAGGGGGGMFDQFESDLTTPGITYQPVALQALVGPEYQRLLDDVIQRNSGMLTQPEGFLLS